MPIYSISGFQEPFSCFSHLFAAPFFLFWGFWLIRRWGRDAPSFWGLLVLTLTTVFLLSMSGVYHLLGPGTARMVLKQLDIAGVFALIAGTATPIHSVAFRGMARWLPLGIAWVVAIAGITLRSIFADSLPLSAGTGIFLLMGWGGLVTAVMLWRRYGFQFVRRLLEGGVAYSLGAVFLLLHRPTLIPGVVGPHELWHLAVLGGLTLHWLFVIDCIRLAQLENFAFAEKEASC